MLGKNKRERRRTGQGEYLDHNIYETKGVKLPSDRLNQDLTSPATLSKTKLPTGGIPHWQK